MRTRGDLIEMYKHFNRYDKTAMEAPSFVCRSRPSRKHKYHLVQAARDRARSLRTNSFYHRVTKIWNDLPRSVAEAEDVNKIKNVLDEHMESHPLRYDRSAASVEE